MGANFVSLSIRAPDQIAACRIFEEAQRRCRYENGHSYSGGIGMADGLKFLAWVFETKQEADDWLADHAEKWEAALAVRVAPKDPTVEPYWRIGAWCSS